MKRPLRIRSWKATQRLSRPWPCVDDESIHKSKHFKEIQYTYKWTTTSKDKLFNDLSERETIYGIVSFENFKFENTSDDVISANEKVSNIFEKMAKRT
jgi:hypothetical protein